MRHSTFQQHLSRKLCLTTKASLMQFRDLQNILFLPESENVYDDDDDMDSCFLWTADGCGNSARPDGVALARMMGGPWAKELSTRERTKGPPITIWSFLTGSGIKHAVSQAWLPTFCPGQTGAPVSSLPARPCVGAACWREWVEYAGGREGRG